MCNPTSSPPRRDLYELVTSMAATERPSFLPETPHLRIGIRGWTSGRVGLYNANYANNGDKFLTLDRPWTVVTPSDFQAFATHAEALACAFRTPDPAPQEQSSVTTGWQPVPDHADAWQEKWNLTR